MDNRRFYSKDHIWVEQDGDICRLGISNHAQEKLGNVMFLNLPEMGEVLVSGERFGDIESIKTVSDLISPVSGEVIAVNEVLLDAPEEINERPYECWMLKVKADIKTEGLMDEDEYRQYLEKGET